MGQFPGFLSALGQAFGGYGQDQQNQLARQRQAGLDAQAAQRLTMDQSLANAQIGNYKSEADQRTSAIEAARIKALSNQRAHAALSKLDPSVGEYDDGTDYQTALKSTQEGAAKQRLEVAKQRRDYNTLKAEFKTHPLAAQPFSEQDPADYTAALGDARDLRKVNAAAGKQHWVSAGTDPTTGQPLILNAETGETKQGGGLKGGQGAMATREKDFVGLMDQAMPTMKDLALKVRPWAISGALKNPTLGNAVLNQDEQNYLASARNFLAGALHQESGTRLTDSQILFGQSRYLPVMGDTPETIMSKLANAEQTHSERRANLQGAPQTAKPTASALPSSSAAPMTEDAWAAKNPPKAGESFDQYHARFRAAQGRP